MFIWTCVLFQTVSEIELFECTTAKLLIRRRYYVYVLFLITVFIVRVTELVQFIINVRKFHRQHQCTLQLVWRHGVLFVWVRLAIPLPPIHRPHILVYLHASLSLERSKSCPVLDFEILTINNIVSVIRPYNCNVLLWAHDLSNFTLRNR